MTEPHFAVVGAVDLPACLPDPVPIDLSGLHAPFLATIVVHRGVLVHRMTGKCCRMEVGWEACCLYTCVAGGAAASREDRFGQHDGGIDRGGRRRSELPEAGFPAAMP